MAIITAVLSFLTALFQGGLGKVASGLRQILALFQPTLQQKKQEQERAAEEEFRDIEQGGRPKWDD